MKEKEKNEKQEEIFEETDFAHRMESRFTDKEMLEQTVSSLYKNIFGESEISVSAEEIRESKKNVNEKMLAIADGYSVSDFFMLDIGIRKNDKEITNMQTITTSLQEKIIYLLLSFDTQRRERYLDKVQQRYFNGMQYQLTERAIENFQNIIGQGMTRYKTIKQRTKSHRQRIIKHREEHEQKFSYCEMLQDKTVEKIEQDREKLLNIQKDIEKADTSNDYRKYMNLLEKEKTETIERMEQNARTLKKTVYAMKQFDNAIEMNSRRETAINNFYHQISNELMKTELVYNFLQLANEQRKLSEDISASRPDDISASQYIEKGSDFINRINDYNNETYSLFRAVEKESDASLEKLFNNGKMEEEDTKDKKIDVERLITLGDKIRSERRQKEYNKVKELI